MSKEEKKRKVIDLDMKTFTVLQNEADKLHYNFKRYIEYVLIQKAEELEKSKN